MQILIELLFGLTFIFSIVEISWIWFLENRSRIFYKLREFRTKQRKAFRT